MTSILDLFDDETDTLPILYNARLNTELEGLAELLISSTSVQPDRLQVVAGYPT